MAARAYWKGQIRIALVSIPVEVYSATKSGSRISFRQIHEPSGKRIRYEKVVPGIGPVESEDIIKGYEYSRDNYVLLDKDEIDAVKLESRKTLILSQFVDASEIDGLYNEKPYYVVPADDLANEAYIVLREALRENGKVGIGQLAVRGSEHLISLRPCGNGLIMETLRYADEVRKAQQFFDDIPDEKPDKDLMKLAGQLIEDRSAAFEADEYHDRYVIALKELIEKKRKSGDEQLIEQDDDSGRSGGGNVVDLMAALKESVEEGKAGSKKKSAAKKKSASRKKSSGKKSAAG